MRLSELAKKPVEIRLYWCSCLRRKKSEDLWMESKVLVPLMGSPLKWVFEIELSLPLLLEVEKKYKFEEGLSDS